MSEQRTAPLVAGAEQTAAALGLLLISLIWALTGMGYFWPMWVCFAVALTLGLVAAVRWARRVPKGSGRGLARQAALSAVIELSQLAIWAMTGAHYFWPVWPFIGLSGLLGLRWLIAAPRQRSLEVRVDELTRTRSGALDVQAAELRRIERDLHDGAQARLVALSMQLGRAEERLAAHPDSAALVRRARQEATAAIAELRDLARGISPPVLADRGLDAAVRSLADRAGAEVSVNTDLPRRPPPVIENAAYFVVAEALTNAGKHTPGAAVRVSLWTEPGELGIAVADDGLGGADPTGSGLTGLRQRVEALDGWLHVTSAIGEGTTVRAMLPCEW